MTRYTPDLLADDLADLTAIRRDIHRHPETAFEEERTAQIVADKLTSWGIKVHRGLATTGVVGLLKGNRGAGVRRRSGCAPTWTRCTMH
jgi:hippurate hydrolase